HTRSKRDWSSDVCSSDLAAFVSTASGAVYGSPTPTPSPATFEELIEDARSGYSQASSMVSASLDAVVSSVSSVVSPTNPAQAQEIGRASCRERGMDRGVA